MPSRKLLIVGVDAASPTWLRRWAGDGTLPNIAAFMAAGLVGETRNIEGFEGSTWPSFATAVGTGKHGFYWQQQLNPGTYRILGCDPGDHISQPMLWETLSAAGRRVVLLDIPMCPPSPNLNGVQRVEWGGHDLAFGFQTTPPGLRREILAAVGPYPYPGRCDVPSRSTEECRAFADLLLKAVPLGTRLARETLHREAWDFAIQVYGEAHCAGHQLWHLHDPGHPAYDPEVTARFGNPVREVYVAIDQAIGELLADVSPDTTVVLMSLHGMAPPWGAAILIPEILERLGVKHYPLAPAPEGGNGGGGHRLLALYRKLPVQIRQPIYRVRQYVNQRLLGRGEPLGFDPARTRAFDIILGGAFSGIRLNLRGREPHGILESGAEAERFITELRRDLLEITDLRTGRPAISRIIRTAEEFPGPKLGGLPDLIVVWNEENALGTTNAGGGKGARVKVSSPKIGTVEGVNSYCRTGDHLLEGLFVVRGPGIAPGKLDRVVRTIDLAPTFARMMGCEMRDVDGVPIPELLDAPVAAGAGR